MRKYLVCYWVERNDCATDLEDVVEADNISEALDKFKASKVFKSIDSISEIINFNFIP
jgi:hypothetical protein